jgi:hypothetical protein
MTGTIQADGKVLGDDGHTYSLHPQDDGTIKLLDEVNGWVLAKLVNIIGRKVSFKVINDSKDGTHYKVIS